MLKDGKKLKRQFIGQFNSLQWLVRKMESRVWYSRDAYYWGSRCFNPHCEILDRKNTRLSKRLKAGGHIEHGRLGTIF